MPSRTFRSLLALLVALLSVSCGDDDNDDLSSCHTDCFGGDVRCSDGTVTVMMGGIYPCDQSCPTYSFECEEGCGPRGQYSLFGNDFYQTQSNAGSLCLENQSQQLGEPCNARLHCAHPDATYDDNGYAVEPSVECVWNEDTREASCQEVEPIMFDDYLQPCTPDQVGYPDFSWPPSGELTNAGSGECASSICAVATSEDGTCRQAYCSAKCVFDQDCPEYSICVDNFGGDDTSSGTRFYSRRHCVYVGPDEGQAGLDCRSNESPEE